jgi:hypothetical protein
MSIAFKYYSEYRKTQKNKNKNNRKNSNSSVSVKCVGASILLETQHNETKMMAVSRHVMVTVSVPISAFCAVR